MRRGIPYILYVQACVQECMYAHVCACVLYVCAVEVLVFCFFCFFFAYTNLHLQAVGGLSVGASHHARIVDQNIERLSKLLIVLSELKTKLLE